MKRIELEEPSLEGTPGAERPAEMECLARPLIDDGNASSRERDLRPSPLLTTWRRRRACRTSQWRFQPLRLGNLPKKRS